MPPDTYYRRTTPADLARLRRLADSGCTMTQAAAELGWDYQRVQYWRDRTPDLRFTPHLRPVKTSTPKIPTPKNNT
jgi:hypothetical protein